MSDYVDKLASLKKAQDKLAEDLVRLTAERKLKIAELAQRTGVLGLSDAVLTGLFLQSLKASSAIVQEWEEVGARFLKPAKKQKETVEDTAAV